MIDGILLMVGEDVSNDIFDFLEDRNRFVPVRGLELGVFGEGF